MMSPCVTNTPLQLFHQDPVHGVRRNSARLPRLSLKTRLLVGVAAVALTALLPPDGAQAHGLDNSVAWIALGEMPDTRQQGLIGLGGDIGPATYKGLAMGGDDGGVTPNLGAYSNLWIDVNEHLGNDPIDVDGIDIAIDDSEIEHHCDTLPPPYNYYCYYYYYGASPHLVSMIDEIDDDNGDAGITLDIAVRFD